MVFERGTRDHRNRSIVFCTSVNAFANCPDDGDCDTEEENKAILAVEKERIKPLWIAGAVSFSSFYVLTIALTAALSEDKVRGKSVAYAATPVVGPFIAVGNDSDEIQFDDFKVPLILSGVFQIATLGVLVAGLVVKKDVEPKLTLNNGATLFFSIFST